MQHWDRKKYRTNLAKQAGMLILVVASVATLASKSRSKDLGSAPRLKIINSLSIDGLELSGVRVSKNVGSENYNVEAVGDSSPQLVAVVVSNALELVSSETTDFTNAVDQRFALCNAEIGPGCKDALKMIRTQWEALAIDGSGRNFLLQEHSHAIVVMNSSLTSVEHVINYDFSKSMFAPVRDSKKHRRIDDHLSAEGFILLKNGHILIAKEKNPAVLGEFGPAGSKALGVNQDTILGADEIFQIRESAERSSLELLAEWQIAGQGKCDIADLTSDGSGAVYLLSENCKSIQKMDHLDPSETVVVASEQWRLPKGIRHPEGFSIDALNRFWVVIDIRKPGTNLFVLDR